MAEWFSCMPRMLIGQGLITGDGTDLPYYESDITGLDTRSSNNERYFDKSVLAECHLSKLSI